MFVTEKMGAESRWRLHKRPAPQANRGPGPIGQHISRPRCTGSEFVTGTTVKVAFTIVSLRGREQPVDDLPGIYKQCLINGVRHQYAPHMTIRYGDLRLERDGDVAEIVWAAPKLNLFTFEIADAYESGFGDDEVRSLIAEGTVASPE
jgi:hypothetical protein